MPTSDLTTTQSAALTSDEGFLALVERVATNPDLAKTATETIRALLEMRERTFAQERESAYNRAILECQMEMVPIARDAENKDNKSKYAKLETVDRAIRPIYTRHGFALSFSTLQPVLPGNVRVTCAVRHIGGHVAHYEFEAASDWHGPKGSPNKTPIQGHCSATTVLRRYLTTLIFNLVFLDDDRDGQKPEGFISEQQQNDIASLMDQCHMSSTKKQEWANFWKFSEATDLHLIRADMYDTVMAALKDKLRRQQEQ